MQKKKLKYVNFFLMVRISTGFAGWQKYLITGVFSSTSEILIL